MRLLVATRSAHKLGEIGRILAGVPDLELVGLGAAGIPISPEEQDLEPYDTFEANAESKARHFRRISGLPTVADDSGLEVDALNGAPGVRSKRFAPSAGELTGGARDRANNEHLLERLQGVDPDRRTGRYICVAVLDQGGEDVRAFRGEAEGTILEGARGWGGFGYDPLFYDRDIERTFAEIEPSEKNRRSHRGKAFRALAEYLERLVS